MVNVARGMLDRLWWLDVLWVVDLGDDLLGLHIVTFHFGLLKVD
jgi:hypothetical protein